MSQTACRSSLVACRKSHVASPPVSCPRRPSLIACPLSPNASRMSPVTKRMSQLKYQNLKKKKPGDKNSPRPPERYEKLKYYLCCKDKTKLFLSNIFYFFNRILRLPSSLPERLLFGKSPYSAYKALITNEFQRL